MTAPHPCHAHDPALWTARRYVIAGGVVIVGLFGGVALWSVQAELEGAVVAQGELRVETKSKPVQHREGGIVGAIFVRDGDVVKAGDPLVDLERTTQQASLAIVDGQLSELLTRRARLLAERDESARIVFPGEVLDAARSDPDLAEIVHGQRSLFDARLSGYRQQRAQMAERIGQLENEIRASGSRRQALETQARSYGESLRRQQRLLDRGLSTRRVTEDLRRREAQARGDIGALDAGKASLQRQIQETRIEITRLREARREKALDDLRDVETRIAEQRQRRIVAGEALRRIELRAPVDGVVQNMTVFATGAVIAPGEPVMTIVPVADRLVLEAKVSTDKRDRISVAQPTRVRFRAFNQRTTPELNGTVLSISADREIDAISGAPHYRVEILLPDAETARLGEGNVLVPGMPADIFIRTGARSPMTYLFKPILDSFEPAFKE